MPYTDAWNTTRPAGGVAAKNIDDEIRLLRLQLDQRLEDVLVEDMSADPLVLKSAIKGLKVGLQKIIPMCQFINDMHSRENDISSDGYIVGFNDGGNPIIAPIDIPIGCVVTKIEYMVDKNTCTTVNCIFRRKAFVAASGANVAIDATIVNAAGIVVLPTPDLNVTLLPDQYYYLSLSGTGGAGTNFKIYAARITFNRPSTDNAT